MHIPDGYLSPETTVPAFIVMSGVWFVAYQQLKKNLAFIQIPSIALCASFSFILMMFNIPVLGGSSVHAVGAVLVAILLGPWAAVLVLSIVVCIQALIFGDGGIMAMGINCLNMAVIMPFCGAFIYQRLIKMELKNIYAGAVAAYIGVNIAALATAIEMGIQPIFFKTITGEPLYGFYDLSITIPAVMFSHLLVAGPIEAIVTGLTLKYLAKFAPDLLRVSSTSRYQNIVVVLIVLALLSPLGLLTEGTAFGEWSSEEIQAMIGFVPHGIIQGETFWHAILPDYSLGVSHSFASQSMWYIISAFCGIFIVASITLVSGKIITKFRHHD